MRTILTAFVRLRPSDLPFWAVAALVLYAWFYAVLLTATR